MKQDQGKKQVNFLKTKLGTKLSKGPKYSREEMKTKMEEVEMYIKKSLWTKKE